MSDINNIDQECYNCYYTNVIYTNAFLEPCVSCEDFNKWRSDEVMDNNKWYIIDMYNSELYTYDTEKQANVMVNSLIKTNDISSEDIHIICGKRYKPIRSVIKFEEVK